MPEEFITYIWENRLFITRNIKTTDGDSLEIINTGSRNYDSGPDFFNARIKINGTIWAGNIEIHRKASDWHKHHHNKDRAYDNVILHVVEYADRKICRSNGTTISTLKIEWPVKYSNYYSKLLSAGTWIACQEQLKNMNPLFIKLGFHRLMAERLENKTDEITNVMQRNRNDWNETFYQILARRLGFKVNSTPFELLARALPAKILAKHHDNRFQLESLLFGTSGLLEDEMFGDEYYRSLKKEFSFLAKKYNIIPVENHLWKFMRIRPENFPTIRISQLAGLIHEHHGLFSKVISEDKLQNLFKLFGIEASDYWSSHYRFNRQVSDVHVKKTGYFSVCTIIINVVIPFLFLYGEQQNRPCLKNRALRFLEELPPENNSIIRVWRRSGIECRSAFDSQSLLQLKTMYCDRRGCLKCYIGSNLIKRKSPGKK